MTKTGDTLGERFIAALAAAESIDRQTKHEVRQGYPLATEAEVDMMLRAYKKHGSPPHSLAHAKQILASPIFCNWDWRPAVLVGDKAFAVLGHNDPWVSVDRYDVGHTGGVMSEAAWRERFQGYFGPLDLSLIGRARAHIQFVNWDHRPAVLVGGKAFAVLSQGAPGVWKSVDRSAVIGRGLFMTERAWRRMFMGRYGKLKLFRQENRPTAKEFDDAARRLYAADLESKPTKYGFPGVAALFLSRALQQVAENIGDGQLMLYAADMERRARGVIGLYLSCRLPNETAHRAKFPQPSNDKPA